MSAIDDDNGKIIIERLFNNIPDSAIICISHNSWINDYFPNKLLLVD
ncbi:MAG: hypothetical protein OFPII_21900 [Osedax symbiont Rs1]|nr:MAG: hypothetical protein OFPII_21900 [Osedax symbiont Rs1]